jgi:hypothetical protein
MEQRTNRWITTLVLVGFFAIIAAAAGRQGPTTTTSNVIVANTSAQQVPVRITSSVSTPINVNNYTHGKDGLQILKVLSFQPNIPNASATLNAVPGERFVITNISVNFSLFSSNDSLTGIFVDVKDSHGNLVASQCLLPQVVSNSTFTSSTVNQTSLLYLDPGQHLTVEGYRGMAESANCFATFSGYRVAYP